MPPPDTIQLIIQGGAVVVLAIMAWWSRDGSILWGKAVAAQIRQYETQIADLQQQIKDLRADHRAELALALRPLRPFARAYLLQVNAPPTPPERRYDQVPQGDLTL